MNFLLLITTIMILFLILAENGFDFVSPSFLFVAPLTLSVFICVLYQTQWGFECLPETFFLIFAGMLMFYFGDVFGKKMIKRKSSSNIDETCDMSIGMLRVVIIVILSFAALYLTYKEISSSVTAAGMKYSLFNTSTKGLAGNSVSSSVSMINNIMSIIAVYSIVIIGNNGIQKCLKKRDFLLLFPLFCYFIEILLQGQRGDLINIFVSGLFVIFILNYKNKGSSARKNIKLASSFLKYIIGALILFYLLRLTIAKPGQNDLSFFDIISGYIGAQIDLLNNLVRDKNISYEYFGFESFNYIYQFLEKIGIVHNLPAVKFPFKAYNGLGCNVYTFFKRPYVDFGLPGTLLVTFICGSVFGHFYYKYIKVKNANNRYLFYLMMYAYFINKVVMGFFDDYITLLFSANTVIKLVLMCMIHTFMYTKLKIKRGYYLSDTFR